MQDKLNWFVTEIKTHPHRSPEEKLICGWANPGEATNFAVKHTRSSGVETIIYDKSGKEYTRYKPKMKFQIPTT